MIIDDGDGMDSSDATLAFERHATSKLKEVNDLWNIHTMGFRGEALPSIASVSHVLLRTNNGNESTEVEIKYGTLTCAKPCATPKGTMIEVKNLFQKTPARFKHLKSPQYEFSLISDVVQKFALSHPEIGFVLSHDGRTVFKTRGNGSLLEVLMQIYGRETAKTAIALDGKDNDYVIDGYIMQPQYNRATKYYMLLYINGRMIRNYRLQKAVMDAYAPFLPKDRYPIAVINLHMDAQLVDVNVHPSKWEIRLSKEKQLEKLIYQTILEALTKNLQVPKIKTKKEEKKEKIELQTLEFSYERDNKIDQLHIDVNESLINPQNEKQTVIMEEIPKENIKSKEESKTENKIVEDKKSLEEEKMILKDCNSIYTTKEESIYENVEEQDVVATNLKVEESNNIYDNDDCYAFHPKEENHKLEIIKEQIVAPKNPSLPQLRVIGQFHNNYIIAEGEKGLYIIDQHAAQERYHYEEIRKQILAGVTKTQPLLIPITIESTMSAVSQVDDINSLLGQLGIHLDVFGNTTFVCRELPVWMKDIKEEEFLQDMIDIWEKDKEICLEKLRKHAISTMACHSSIRFNRSLTLEEMKQVIKDLEKCEQPFHCPHGRPTLICMEDKDLIHEFERG